MGKTALVTGGARRLGAAMALALAKRGVHIVVHHASRESEAHAVVQSIASLGVEAKLIQADFLDLSQVDRTFDQALELTGTVDILVNNASIYPRTSLESMDWLDLQENVKVNAWAPFRLSQHFASCAKNSSGVIVNVLDGGVARYDDQHVAYQTSKYMLKIWTQMMAMTWAPLRVNAIGPGPILPASEHTVETFAALVKALPLARAGTVQEVVHALLFLLENEYVTGHMIHVDGGYHLKGRHLS